MIKEEKSNPTEDIDKMWNEIGKKVAKELFKETERQAIQKWDSVVEWRDLNTNSIRKRVI